MNAVTMDSTSRVERGAATRARVERSSCANPRLTRSRSTQARLTQPRSTPRRRSAFTLFELLLALAVLVIFGAMTYTALRGPMTTQRLKKSGELVRAEWARARLRAMRTGRVHVFRYEPSGTQFFVETLVTALDDVESTNDFSPTGQAGVTMQANRPSAKTIDLPEGVRFHGGETAMDARASQFSSSAGLEGGSAMPVLFYPDGTTSEAAIVLINDRQQCVQVTLRGLTGSSLSSQVMTLDEVFQ